MSKYSDLYEYVLTFSKEDIARRYVHASYRRGELIRFVQMKGLEQEFDDWQETNDAVDAAQKAPSRRVPQETP